MNAVQRLLDLYRSWGAELPGGDLVGARGVSMDGWFWRLTDQATGQVVVALAGLNTPRAGQTWGIVALLHEPSGTLRTAILPDVAASPRGMRLSMRGDDEHFLARRGELDVAIGGLRLTARLDDLVDWQGRLGGSSIFQVVPFMNQYWHPWLLGGRATATLTGLGTPVELAGATVYAEKNWGRGGFPLHWWWGQAQAFADRDACVAFAGGQIHLGRPGRRVGLATDVTALVVRLPDGRQVRLGNPGTSPVRAQVHDGHWRLSGRGGPWQVDLEATSPLPEAFVLPVPLVEERRLAPGALEAQLGHLEVTVRRGGRLVWQGSSDMAALETGSRAGAEAELARRGGNPSPVR